MNDIGREVLDAMPWHPVDSAAQVAELVTSEWQVFLFHGPRGARAALYGRSRVLKVEGIDALVRPYAEGYVLIARRP